MRTHEKIQEIVKCGEDPVYFINTYLKVQHPLRGTIPFNTYAFQDDVIRSLEDHRFNIVLKSRQLGLSTIAAAYAVWYSIFYKDKSILVIATKLPTAQNFIKKVKVFLNNLPDWLILPKMVESSKSKVGFDNGSSITAIPTGEDAGRSEALSLLIVDEAAFIRNFDQVWTGLKPTVSTGGRALIISTPNGVGGMYYKLWSEAESGINEFNAIRLPWTVHPEHDDVWFQSETKGMTRKQIAQEFLCDFTSSGDTYLQPEDLDWVLKMISEPVKKTGPNNGVWIWKDPEPEKKYVISADVARGDSGDYSAFHVIDADTCEIVAEYMGKIPPESLATLVEEYGYKYNTALLCPENNTFGYFTCTLLKKNAYPRLFYMKAKGDPFEYASIDPDELPGFSTQQKTRVQILAKLEELIRNKAIVSYSQRLYAQLQSFIWNGTKPGPMKDAHDDLVMSAAIGAWLVGGAFDALPKEQQMAVAMLKGITSIKKPVNPRLYEINNMSKRVDPFFEMNANDVYKPKDPEYVKHATVNDFDWLLR